MKVLMLLENCFPPDSRVEKEALTLLRSGHEVHIAAICGKKDLQVEVEYKGITVHYRHIPNFVKKASALALRVPVYFIFWKRYIRELLKKNSYDIIHVHDLPLAKVGIFCKKKFGYKLVIDLHENYPDLVSVSPYSKTFFGKLFISIDQWRKYEKSCLKEADLIVTVVEEMTERVLDKYTSLSKLVVLQNTPLLENVTYREGKNDDDNITLFYSGGITHHRGLQIVVRGLAKLDDKKVKLWIVGDGSYQQKIKDLAKELGLEKQIVFYGWRPFDEMLKLQSDADIALIPHLKSVQSDNSSPNKLFDYMYFKKPVFSSDCNSLKRIINETQSGIIYSSDDPDSFAKELVKLYDSEYRTTLGNNGHQAVKKIYNWQESSKDFVNAYSNL